MPERPLVTLFPSAFIRANLSPVDMVSETAPGLAWGKALGLGLDPPVASVARNPWTSDSRSERWASSTSDTLFRYTPPACREEPEDLKRRQHGLAAGPEFDKGDNALDPGLMSLLQRSAHKLVVSVSSQSGAVRWLQDVVCRGRGYQGVRQDTRRDHVYLRILCVNPYKVRCRKPLSWLHLHRDFPSLG